MKRPMIQLFLAILLPFAIISCKKPAVKQIDEASMSKKSLVYEYDFNNGISGWEAGYADYPVGMDDIFEFENGFKNLPEPLDTKQLAFNISGNNHSDDLFMFIKTSIDDLAPNTTYEIKMEANFASPFPKGSFGVGGSPGESTYFKAGASTEEPKPIVTKQDYYRMNIDVGSQSNGGEDMIVLGDIAGERYEDNNLYEMIKRTNENTRFTAKSDENGKLWVIVGTDSGFEAVTSLYYSKIQYTLNPIQ